jgi:hypothetical protein
MKILSLLLILGMLVAPLTAIAEDPQCSLIRTDNESREESHYINPKQISSLTIIQDTASVSTGTSGRYVLVVTMTNGDNILYGRYASEHLRRNAVKQLYGIVLACNQ